MDLTKAQREHLWRLAETYRTAQERARSALITEAKSLIDQGVRPSQIANVAGMSRQQLNTLIHHRTIGDDV